MRQTLNLQIYTLQTSMLDSNVFEHRSQTQISISSRTMKRRAKTCPLQPYLDQKYSQETKKITPLRLNPSQSNPHLSDSSILLSSANSRQLQNSFANSSHHNAVRKLLQIQRKWHQNAQQNNPIMPLQDTICYMFCYNVIAPKFRMQNASDDRQQNERAGRSSSVFFRFPFRGLTINYTVLGTYAFSSPLCTVVDSYVKVRANLQNGVYEFAFCRF